MTNRYAWSPYSTVAAIVAPSVRDPMMSIPRSESIRDSIDDDRGRLRLGQRRRASMCKDELERLGILSQNSRVALIWSCLKRLKHADRFGDTMEARGCAAKNSIPRPIHWSSLADSPSV